MSILSDDRAATEPSWWGGVCRTLFNNRLVKPLVATTTRRRVLVVAYALVLLAFPLAGWLTGRPVAVAIIALFYLVGTVLIAVATGGILDKPIRALDERQRHVRVSLFNDPYSTGAALGLAGGLVIAFSLRADDAMVLGVFMFVFGAIFGLPAMLYTWAIPDVEDEDA